MSTAFLFFVIGYVSHDFIKDEVTSIVLKVKAKFAK